MPASTRDRRTRALSWLCMLICFSFDSLVCLSVDDRVCRNAGTCCVSAVDDVGFLSEMFWVVSQAFRVRADSVHVAGFSNGGFMTESLACHWDRLNSAASVSGDTILFPGQSARCRTARQHQD